MSPEYQVIVEHTAIGRRTLKEPLGKASWATIWERHPEGKSLVEAFEGDLIFYGPDLALLKELESQYGPDAKVVCEVYKRFNPSDAFTLIRGGKGLLALSTAREVFDPELNRMTVQYDFIRDDFWSRFMARAGDEIDVSSVNDLNGDPVDAATPTTATLPGQVLPQTYEGTSNEGADYTIPDGQYGQLNFLDVVTEIETKFTLPSNVSEPLPAWMFDLKYGGNTQIDAAIYLYANGNLPVSADLQVYIQWNNEAPIPMGHNDQVDGTIFTLVNSTSSRKPGDIFRIYIKNETGGDYDVHWYDEATHETTFSLTQFTTYPTSNATGYLVHDLGRQITDRIAGNGRFKSNYLGHTTLTTPTYASDGGGSLAINFKGYQLRGYSIANKPFFESWLKWFNSLSALHNLGFGHVTINGQEIIEVEKVEEFFNAQLQLYSFVSSKLSRAYDQDSFVKSFKMSFSDWEPDTASGVNVPQSEASYLTKLERTGVKKEVVCEMIAGDVVIEEARRQRAQPTKDYTYDSNTFIVAIKDDLTPELDEGFEDITNLDESDTRYNIRFWPIWNLLRHFNWITNGLQNYQESLVKFSSGKGNYKAGAKMLAGTDEVATEDLNYSIDGSVAVNVTKGRGTYLHSAELFDIEIAMTCVQFEALDLKKGIIVDGQLYFIKNSRYVYETSTFIGQGWPRPATSLSRSAWQWESGEYLQWESGERVNHESL